MDLRALVRPERAEEDAAIALAAVVITQLAVAATILMALALEGLPEALAVLPEWFVGALTGLLTASAAWRWRQGRGSVPKAVAWLNAGTAGALNLAVAARSTVPIDEAPADASWWFAVGAIAVVGAVCGWLSAAILACAAVSVMGAMVVLSQAPPTSIGNYFVEGAADLVVVVAATELVSRLIQRRADAGRMEGRLVAHGQMLRTMHDTALQALEAIALRAESGGPPDDVLADVHRHARREATALRHLLKADPDGAAGDVQAAIERLGETFAGRGLQVELVLPDIEDVRLEPAALDALVWAAGEALANVVKHSGSSGAVLLAGVDGPDLVVSVRDHGVGFDTARPRDGFGVDFSIRARLKEIGGDSEIWSRPGRGTRVTLRLPTRQVVGA
ncbi:sensor histidine kinase [Kineosporia sp. A_224]|uniref:sensor histidine kinase n=1 Tax=Kineosporia sp. A_224 TaxID=1962180 RepID=UPI00117A5F43|nr:ATP-binding protein [Kineosporia sp. A_224]